MILFKNLFKFSKNDVNIAFNNVCGKKYYAGLTLLQSKLPSTDISYGKLLIITPRASGNAVERNRIRRQIKAVFYEEDCYKKPQCWIVLVNKRATRLSFEKLKNFLITNML